MKRCPECRRDYTDDTLLYCLDDGNALLDGPATVVWSGDEPATAIMPAVDSGLARTAILSASEKQISAKSIDVYSVTPFLQKEQQK